MARTNEIEGQAVLSLWLGLAGFVAFLGAAFLLMRNLDIATLMVTYRSSAWLFLLMGGLLASLALSATGWVLAFNTAGHRRNSKSGLSWMCFFLNAGVLLLAALAGLFFYFTRQAA
ncbi:MAG: hypothetical protein IPM18_06910 [Phycisphaerales bacterium]|nr:hypothetical protein [Phycisphaerales bacterium]